MGGDGLWVLVLLSIGQWAVLGYLAGSLPTGVLVGRMVGRDPRRAGSGNIGASNVTRTLGKHWGAVVLVIDLLKGAVPVWVAAQWSLEGACAAGIAAVLGHCYPVWLRFKGGKGVATTFGALAVFAPVIALLIMTVWIATVFLTRVPALGSLLAALLMVVLPHVDHQPFPVHVFTLAAFVIIVLRHRGNLQVLKARRARRGRRVQQRRKGQGAKRAKQARKAQQARRR